MARLFTFGFEQNSQLETTLASYGDLAIQTTTKRSGGYAGKWTCTNGGAGRVGCYPETLGTGGTWYSRVYFNLEASVNQLTDIMLFRDGLNNVVYIHLKTNDTLEIVDSTTAKQTVMGSASGVLTKGVWYRIEMMYDYDSKGLTGKIDGTAFATGTCEAQCAFIYAYLGKYSRSTATAGVFYEDDWALNSNTGAVQNSYPGEGKVINLQPNGDGDAHAWLKSDGSAGDANNYQAVDEVGIDSADYNKSQTLNAGDMYNCVDSGIQSYDTVSVVHVGCYFNRYDALPAAFKLQIKKTTGGTITQSAAITPSATGWRVNNNSGGYILYPITAYLNPDGAYWTQATLESMQIGMIISTGTTVPVYIATIWAVVEYVAGTTNIKSINGLLRASISKVNGLASAGLKSWNGLT